MVGIVQPQPFKTLGPALRSGVELNAAIAAGQVNYQDGMTALAGGAQAGSPLLTLGINKVTTIVTGGDSVQLPPSGTSLGGEIVVANTTASTSLQVFANVASSIPSGVLDTINGTAGATGVAVAGGKTAIFWTTAAGAWFGPVALA